MVLRVGSALLLLCCLLSVRTAGQQRPIVGILPVFDASGDAQSEVFTSHLTLMIYERLQGSAVQPRLLNPGGLYNPLSPEWPIEFGESAGVDVLLISTMLSTEKPKKGDWTLRVETSLLDIRSGKKVGPALYRYDIDRKYVGEKAYITTGSYRASSEAGRSVVEFVSRPFDKQPIGKAARSLAESISSDASAQSASIATAKSGAARAPEKGRCTAAFSVVYAAKKTNSKAYAIVANSKDESLWVKDGVARLDLSSGPLVVQVSTEDAPYRLPVQRLYQADTLVDCSREQNALVLEIGGGGEALLQWR